MTEKHPHIEVITTVSAGIKTVTLRDEEGACLEPQSQYIYECSKRTHKKRSKQAIKSALAALIGPIVWFAEYLAAIEEPLTNVSDEMLEAFADWALTRVKADPRSRGSVIKNKKTVNIKIQTIYGFIVWCQKLGFVPKRTIGWSGCRVKSSLVDLELRNFDSDKDPRNKYPKCYRDLGSNSPSQHWATDGQIRKIGEEFRSKSNKLTRFRNLLMLRVTDFLAFRASSANSLLASQFSEDAFKPKNGETHFEVSPPFQKGGHEYTFEMSWELAIAIQDYINDEKRGRKAILKKCKVSESVAQDHLFLNTRTGAPMTTEAWISIFSKAFKAVGVKRKGAGMHSVRRRAGHRQTEKEIAYLSERGAPVTESAVVAAVAEYLGHSTLEAQRAYRRTQLNLRRGSIAEKFASENETLLLSRDALARENDLLREEMRGLLAAGKAKPRRHRRPGPLAA